MDRRAEKEARFLRTTLGDGVIERITGNRPDPFYVASKILWYRRYEPDNFSQTSLFVQANGFINYKLTNRFSMDNVHASLLQLRDYRDDTWSEELCETVGVEPDLFPPNTSGTGDSGRSYSKSIRFYRTSSGYSRDDWHRGWFSCCT